MTRTECTCNRRDCKCRSVAAASVPVISDRDYTAGALPPAHYCERCGKDGATVERVQSGSHWWFHPACEFPGDAITDTQRLEWLDRNPNVLRPESAIDPSWNNEGLPR